MPGKKIKSKSKAAVPQKPEALPSPEASAPEAGECPVVGFGASAGGLEAFTELLEHIPHDPGIALVLVQHLDPKHASILTELLARSTSLPVLQVADGMHVEPNHVYVIPPNTLLKISGGRLRLEPRALGQNMPIDVFFRSMAGDLGNKAIGVILSGTASDGTLGLTAIKSEGGITFAQDVQSAKYDGMPRSAVAAGCVDFVLPPDQIAREVLALCRHPYVNGKPAPGVPEEETYFKEIFNMLHSATGVDFSRYKPGTIRRRTLRRMALQKIRHLKEYVRHLKDNRAELQLLFQDILINVTGFFRESATFDFLKARVLPVLFKDRARDEAIRVWAPGCSTGEEVYSIAICLLEHMRDISAEVQLQIFGTDLSETALEKARAGLYPDNIAAEVSAERLRRFFVPVNGSYQISRSVRDACVFARQNVTRDPPFSKLDLILCRNVLIYLGPVLQANVLRLFHYALRPNGFLVLGHSETIGNAIDYFTQIDKQIKVYERKQGPPAIFAADFGAYENERAAQAAPRQVPDKIGGADLQRKVDQLLLARYSPSAVVVDSHLRIEQFRGDIPAFVTHAPGDATLDLNRMTPAGVSQEIRKLVHKAGMKAMAVRSGHLTARLKDGAQQVRLSVSPIPSPGPPHFLVVFEDAAGEAGPAPPKLKGARAASGVRVRELEQELSGTRKYLQTVIEEQEAATEELKSAHEEVQSANEELQSTNEELLTAKEELQSTNEELTTVNEEMQSRNAELQQINDDVINLLSSVNIPIIMLGNDLRIRRFTPLAEKMLNLLPSDMGRPISDFRLKINVPDLAALCEEVVENLTPRQREVQDLEGRSYSMWIRPYRTAENRIDGVVLTMFDVTERRQSAGARYRRLFEAAPDGMVIAAGRTGEVLDVNPFVTRRFGYPKGHLVGQRFWETPLFANSPINAAILSRLADAESLQIAASLRAQSGDYIDTEVTCSIYEEGDSQVIQLNIRDLSARKRLEQQWRRDEAHTRRSQTMEAVTRLAGGVAHDFNDLLTAILGYSDLLAQEIRDNAKAGPYLEQIRHSGERARLVTRQLLAFGRQPIATPELLDLNRVVEEGRQMVQVMLPNTVELRTETSAEACRVRADRAQLEQVIVSLALHAAEAIPAGGQIVLSAANVQVDSAFAELHPAVPIGNYATLSVRDTGARMDAETPPHRLEPSFTAKPAGDGGGPGLAAAYAMVRHAGGHIWAYSELGIGATFTIYLPRITEEAGPGVAAAEDPHGTETVLVVEEMPAVRHLARLFLEQRGYQVLEATSGREALQLAQQHEGPIHLLLTEVVMPRMSGRELAFQFASRRPDMKVLYMSGHTEEAIRHHGVLEDGAAFLPKPFTPQHLALKVRGLLDDHR
jgi:two-component system, chemotaxis family, CheB/CheR fusion protein